MSQLKKKNDDYSIINSLKDIKNYRYASQSKKFDKYFKSFNIDTLGEKLLTKKKPESFLSSKLYKECDYYYNISKDKYDYIPDQNGEKKPPVKLLYKGTSNNFLKNIYNPEFEEKPNDNDLIYIKKDKTEDIIKNKNYNFKRFEMEIFALDPGKYHPNYNSILKKVQSVDFSKSTSRSSNIFQNEFLPKITNDVIDNKIENTARVYKEKNINNNKKENNIIKKENLNEKYFENKNENNYDDKNDNKIKETEKKNNFIIIVKKMHKSNSTNDMKKNNHMFSFKKMMGRRNSKRTKKIVYEPAMKTYNPNYDFALPHLQSFLFKPAKIKQNHKKYLLGKIIRSYRFNSNGYYILDQIHNKNVSL